MSLEDFTHFLTHDVARAEIEAWRGECLDVFSLSEAMIGALLELARERGFEVELHEHPLQRTLEVVKLVELVEGSDQERQDARDALARWQGVESRGEMLARGAVTETLDRKGQWYAIIDMVNYRSGKANKGRWVVSRAEADEFQDQLKRAHTKIKLQLGCVRLRLDD